MDPHVRQLFVSPMKMLTSMAKKIVILSQVEIAIIFLSCVFANIRRYLRKVRSKIKKYKEGTFFVFFSDK
jgi:hypothetical protein